MTVHQDVADRVRGHRARRRMTQKQAAAVIGVSPRTFGLKERGSSDFTVPEVLALAEAFGVSVSDLFPDDRSSRAVVGAISHHGPHGAASDISPGGGTR